jgi:hypothetical protein
MTLSSTKESQNPNIQGTSDFLRFRAAHGCAAISRTHICLRNEEKQKSHFLFFVSVKIQGWIFQSVYQAFNLVALPARG